MAAETSTHKLKIHKYVRKEGGFQGDGGGCMDGLKREKRTGTIRALSCERPPQYCNIIEIPFRYL